MVEFNKKFEEDCLQSERLVKKGPGAEIIKEPDKAANLHNQLNAASEYYLKGAKELLYVLSSKRSSRLNLEYTKLGLCSESCIDTERA